MYTDLPDCWNLKGVSFFDGQIRLKGYDYIISIDPDEYLIPTLNENYKCVFVSSFYHILSHNNPCFRCKIAITNFLVSQTCEIRFLEVIGQSTLYLFIPTQKIISMAGLPGEMSMLWNLISFI